jgi:hypothetical protein
LSSLKIQTPVLAKMLLPPTTLSPLSYLNRLEDLLLHHILTDSEMPFVRVTSRIPTTIKLLITALQFEMFWPYMVQQTLVISSSHSMVLQLKQALLVTGILYEL